MESAVSYGNTTLNFSIERSGRNSLAIEVHPDLSIIVIAPMEAAIQAIHEKVLKRARWIIKQQQFFEQFLPRTPSRAYVSGESHFYLGRKYLLKVRNSDQNLVKLKGGELIVFVKEGNSSQQVKELLTNWYYQHAKRKFKNCLDASKSKFKNHDIPKDLPLVIKRMKNRWGSCTPKGSIILNPEIIKTSSKCIEYVVIHELCHLVHPNHSKEFYKLQSEILPEWQKWKMRLEKTLI